MSTTTVAPENTTTTVTPNVTSADTLGNQAPVSKRRNDEFAYATELRQAMVNQHSWGASLVLIFSLVVLAAAVAWASVSKLEEITRGNAKVIPTSREQLVQSLEGGIVAEILVKEGQLVEKGQPLVRIDPTKAQSAYAEGRTKVSALKGAAARLRAEARGTALEFPADVLKDAEVVRNERSTYNAKKTALDQSVATLKSSRELMRKELAILEPMVEKGLVAEVEVLKMRRQVFDFELQMQERTNRYRSEASVELAKVESELGQSSDALTARADQVKRTVIGASVRGTIKNIKINTIGGVVQPGQEIMEIVPSDDKLLVEAKIRPHDVAFLRPGLPATVKISAYDYAIYGGLQGTVELISPDTMREERKTEDDTYYRVLVRTDSSALSSTGKDLPIMPGMTASVEIKTGQKTVLDYLLKPVLKVREAMRER
jgi:membrane fusion protein, adhesin transport system